MAVRTETQVLDLIRAITEVGINLHGFLTGQLVTDINSLETQIAVGDSVDENGSMTNAMRNFIAQLGRAFDAWKSIPKAAAPAMGRLAGSPDLTSFNQNIDFFQQFQVDNSNEIEERGYTKDSGATVVGSGAGVLSLGSVDLNGDTIDYGHVEDFVLECTRDLAGGSGPGAEEFLIRGESVSIYPWDENGSTLNQSYNYPFGIVPSDFDSSQQKSASGSKIKSNSGSIGNLIANGDFEIAISGGASDTDKLSQWDISAGASDVTQEITDPINGVNSLACAGNFVMDTVLLAGVRPGTFVSMAIKVDRKSSATGTLTIKLMDQDEGATHATLTIDVSTLSNDTPVVLALAAPFAVPLNAEDLKIQIELSTLAVGTIVIDDVMLVPAILANGYTMAIFDGTTQNASQQAQGRYKKGDTYTIQTVSTDAGTNQKFFFNFGLGRYARSAVAATANWEDN